MCGRISTAFLSPEKLKHHFSLDRLSPFNRSYNIAPSLLIPSIRQQDHQRSLDLLKWGLIPHWSKDKDTGLHTFNARAETLSQKPAFRESFKHRRCIIPVSGFYEWQKSGDTKQPYYIYRSDKEPLAFAGLWDSWVNKETGEVIESCAIVTVPASDQMQAIHDRMPAILEKENYGAWLDPLRDTEALQAILESQCKALEVYAVSSYVNNVKNEGEGCLEKLA